MNKKQRTTSSRLIVERLEDRCVPAVTDFRSMDGTGNNLTNPDWGSTDEQLLRMAAAAYADGLASPAGTDLLSAREISNLLAAHIDDDTPNNRNLTAYLYIWGQFLDHDLDLTGAGSPKEAFNIAVPTGDEFFDPASTGSQVIPLTRSIFDATTGTTTPRQQINQITAWIDGSMIYGSSAETAASLRTFSGGLLKTSGDNLPPTDADGNFLAGDIRANENIELTSMHTLFLREHNRLAGQIAAANPSLTDEDIYQQARALVIAELQVITYKEWLPALLGPNALRAYRGYNANVNPQIANEFSTAAFRLHTTINDDVEFFDNDGRAIAFTYQNAQGETVAIDGAVALRDAFFNPSLFGQAPLGGIYKYAASSKAEEIDMQVVDSLRNFLFGEPGQGGLDLASLNIQRGRDHGLADYNSVRAAYGLPRVASFAQITSDVELQQKLETLYGSVDKIDLWVGVLAENHVRGSSVGALTRRILADQFERLRDGDRFWYQRVFSGTQLRDLERTTLAQVIQRNSDVTGLQRNVFFFKAQVQGQVFFDRNGDGRPVRGENPIGRVQVDLLDDAGDVIASTLTDRSGRYTFANFTETGDYQIRVNLPASLQVTTTNPQPFLIATGDATVRGKDIGIRLLDRSSITTPQAEFADILAALGIEVGPPRRR